MYQRLPSLLLLLPVLSAVDAFHSLFPNRAFSRLSRQSKPLYSSTFASTTISSPSSHSPSVSEKKRDSVQVLEYLQSFLTSAPTASSSTTTTSSATPASLPPLDPNLPSDVKAALDDVLAMVQAREEQVRNGDDGARAVKEWKTRAYRLEQDLQATRRNLKEITNIRRDLAHRLQQAQTVAEAGRRGNEERVRGMEEELAEKKRQLTELQEREASLAQAREAARRETDSLLAILSPGQEASRREALEARLASLSDSLPASRPLPEVEELVGEGEREAYRSWYARCFSSLEQDMKGVEDGALRAMEEMRGEVKRMEGCVRAAEEGEGGRRGGGGSGKVGSGGG
ncbi:hypothetical protein Naga_100912g1 [Nannochloropsis gaditana]|uniref:Uncharacterized protein n=1 Tax=Nannochloropsis gaditana TaxID=72520 RepID=W7TCQ2_9STRA|nr:hypothetical protein Naga_100912g1 [Nannochloropsis gaditana]